VRKAGSPNEHFCLRKKTCELFYDEDDTGKIKETPIAELDPGLKFKARHFDADVVA
jgi:hypothetical protein